MRRFAFTFFVLIFVFSFAVVNAQEARSEGLTSCFAEGGGHYDFGSVQVSIDSKLQSTVPGVPMTFTGNLINSNPYPIVDGTVYIKVYRDGELVDQRLIREHMDIPADGKRSITFDWQVPNYAISGDYKLATFFSVAKKFNLLGLPHTDNITGNTVRFSVKSSRRGAVEFDKSSITFNDAPYTNRTSAAGQAVTITAQINNTTGQDKVVPVIWRLYKDSQVDEDNFIDEKLVSKKIRSGSPTTVQFTTLKDDLGLYHLVGEVRFEDTSSFINVSFHRPENTLSKIHFATLTDFPLERGSQASIFACINSSNEIKNGKLELTLTNDNGREVHSHVYEGVIPAGLHGVDSSFTSGRLFEAGSLSATLYSGGKIVDKATLTYDCSDVGEGQCSEREGMTDKAKSVIAKIIILLIIIGVVVYIIRRWRSRITNENV